MYLIQLINMKLEHKRQKVISLPHFFLRLGRYTIVAIALIAFSVAMGSIGYHFFAQLGWLDSFHMAGLILTGMGPVETMARNGAKIIDSLYSLYSGVAFLSITAVFFAPIIHRLLHILQVEKGGDDYTKSP